MLCKCRIGIVKIQLKSYLTIKFMKKIKTDGCSGSCMLRVKDNMRFWNRQTMKATRMDQSQNRAPASVESGQTNFSSLKPFWAPLPNTLSPPNKIPRDTQERRKTSWSLVIFISSSSSFINIQFEMMASTHEQGQHQWLGNGARRKPHRRASIYPGRP